MALTSEIRDKKILSMYPVSGGDINSAFQLTLVDGTQLFMKRNSLPFFELEAKGLEAIRNTKTIRVPKVIEAGNDGEYYLLLEWIEPGLRVSGFWETFGHELAAMHRAPGFSSFGWTSDNYIGARPQINTQSDKWIPFFRDYRLTPQFKSAQHYFDASDWKRITRLLDHLDEYLSEPSRPSLLHGDLWSGNYITGSDGKAWLIDPAVYVGHAETDLAMTELFGGFHPRFYAAYKEANPLQPGYEERRDLYNLYHLLNHLNLFGIGYLGSVREVLRKYCKHI